MGEHVKSIGDRVAALSRQEAVDLAEYLRDLDPPSCGSLVPVPSGGGPVAYAAARDEGSLGDLK